MNARKGNFVFHLTSSLLISQFFLMSSSFAQSADYSTTSNTANYSGTIPQAVGNGISKLLNKIPYVNRYASTMTNPAYTNSSLPGAQYINGLAPVAPGTGSPMSQSMPQSVPQSATGSIFDLVQGARNVVQNKFNSANKQYVPQGNSLDKSTGSTSMTPAGAHYANPGSAAVFVPPQASDPLYTMAGPSKQAGGYAAPYIPAADKWGLSNNFPLQTPPGGDDTDMFAFPSDSGPEVYQRKRGASMTDNGEYTDYSIGQFFKDHSDGNAGGRMHVRGSRNLRQ